VRKGEAFNIVVRQVTNAVGKKPDIIFLAPGSTGSNLIKWRRILGAFQFTIPVRTRALILEREEGLLSILRWIQETIPSDNRWFPVFNRYLDQIADRVDGFGGNSGQITPSPDGTGRLSRCDHKLKWLVPLLLAFMLVLIGVAPLIWSAPLAAAAIVLVLAAACYWYWRCKASLCDFLWAFILGFSVAYLVLGIIVLLGYRGFGPLLMLALLAILNGALVFIVTIRGCCWRCAEKKKDDD
jgi:hypothetical protein